MKNRIRTRTALSDTLRTNIRKCVGRCIRKRIKITSPVTVICSFLLLFTVIWMCSCRSQKKPASVERSLSSDEETAFYTSCYPIESLSIPSCKLEISSGNRSIVLDGSIYIRPDSIFYFRGKLLIDAVRGAIYRDSFIIVNYMDRICYKGKNEYLQRITGYPVNPGSLMMLVTADRCEETYRSSSFTLTRRDSNYLSMRGNSNNMLEMTLNPHEHTVESIVMNSTGIRQKLFSASYSGYRKYRQFVIPAVLDISTSVGSTPVRIKTDFQQILFDQPQQVNLNVPSSYRVIHLL